MPAPPTRTDDFASHGRGWQREAAPRVEENHREFQVFPALSQNVLCCVLRAEQAVAWPSLRSRLVLSCGSTPLSSASCCSVVSTFPSLRPRASSADVAVHLTLVATIVQHAHGLECWGGRGFAVESAAARICREAGARVTTNIFVRDLDLGAPIADARRLEVVADGLPLHGGRQLASGVDVLTVKRDDGRQISTGLRWRWRGVRRKLAWSQGGSQLKPSLSCPSWRRPSPAISHACCDDAQSKRGGMRWCAVLSCAAARAFAASLLGLRPVGSDGSTSFSHKVLTSWRHVGLEGVT